MSDVPPVRASVALQLPADTPCRVAELAGARLVDAVIVDAWHLGRIRLPQPPTLARPPDVSWLSVRWGWAALTETGHVALEGTDPVALADALAALALALRDGVRWEPGVRWLGTTPAGYVAELARAGLVGVAHA